MIAVPTAKKISRTHQRISLKTPGSALVSVPCVGTGSTSGSVDIEFRDLERITSQRRKQFIEIRNGEQLSVRMINTPSRFLKITAQRGNRKSDESCISKWRVEVLNRTGKHTRTRPVRFKTSTLHFEMQDSSDFRFPLWAVVIHP